MNQTPVSGQRLPFIGPGTHVLVMGLGKSGLSAARFCSGLGARVSVSDASPVDSLEAARLRELRSLEVESEFGGHSEALFQSADLILVSPGVPETLPILRMAAGHGAMVTGELSLAAQYMKTPVIAVTGTNGKTTVTTLIGDILKAGGFRVFVGGNIGIPLTDYLAGPQSAEVAVLEVSSFQLDTAVGFKPKVAVLLNISPDHLDRYGSFEAYGDSKFSIFANQGQGDVSILNGDDPEIMARVHDFSSLQHGWAERSALFFGESEAGKQGTVKCKRKIQIRQNGELPEEYDLSTTSLAEPPNRQNALAAIMAARAMGCPAMAVDKGLADFAPLSHRLSLIREMEGVRFVDDSKATNVGAVQSALASVAGPVILIAGGRDKHGGFEMLQELVADKVKSLLLIGEASQAMKEAFESFTEVRTMASMEQAVELAWQIAVAGDVVLLSPACASFDMFSSYAHRGRVFSDLVLGLQEKVER